MVMHVQVQAEQSFVSMDDSINVVLIDPDDRDLCDLNSSHDRDTSNNCRDASMENTRVAISYHTPSSILDLTKDEDDDDSGDEEDDSSVLFRDLLESDPKRLQEDATKEVADLGNSIVASNPFGRFSPEHFFDSLCTASEPPKNSPEPAPPVPFSSKRTRTCPATWSPNCMNAPCISVPSRIEEEEEESQTIDLLPASSRHSRPATPSTVRLQVESDVWNLLGCNSPPNVSELESIWTLTTTTATAAAAEAAAPSSNSSLHRPCGRASLKDRMDRIHRLRVQNRWAGATRHGVTLSQHGTYSPSISIRAASMDVLDAKDYSGWSNSTYDLSFASVMGLSQLDTTRRTGSLQRRQSPLDSTPKAQGYDSDPELGSGYDDDEDQFGPEDEWGLADVSASSRLPFPNSDTPGLSQNAMDLVDSDDQDFMIYQLVQQTLNSTWTLTWHPNADNVKEFQIPSHAMNINIWMERGTVICHNGVVIEPMFMWRDAYQTHDLLQQRKRLNDTCQKPWSMRILNTCRIAPCSSLDKAQYPLARSAYSFIVKTCQNQEFVLEAQSEAQRDLICERWKMVVARFASLAVTEDIDTIAQEFFHPTLSSQTLTVQPQKHSIDSNEDDDHNGMISTSYSGSSASSSESCGSRDWNHPSSSSDAGVTQSHEGTRNHIRWGDI